MEGHALLEALTLVRRRTQELAAPLSAEDQQVQSMPDASPTKWHLAHTSWFFEEFVLRPHARGYEPFDPRFGYLFNSYYEAVGPRQPRPARGLLSRPSLERVRAYRAHVDGAVATLLATGVTPELERVIVLGLNHEEQHQELILTDIKHAFGTSPVGPAYREPRHEERSRAPAALFVERGAGLVSIGHDDAGFAFDNERPRHRVFLETHALANRLVTAGEFAEFVQDGGYTRPELWLADGYAWLRAEGIQAPLYWQRDEESLRLFDLRGGLRPLHPSEPVCHVSYYEADAFARWAHARLPTEFEWEAAATELPATANLLESGRLHPATARGDEHTVLQLFGDVWEWTQSGYGGYPGYRPLAGALGEYNGKFMCNQLVLRGGSCFTPRAHIRRTYRNFFPPSARWQMSGFRLARDAPPPLG